MTASGKAHWVRWRIQSTTARWYIYGWRLLTNLTKCIVGIGRCNGSVHCTCWHWHSVWSNGSVEQCISYEYWTAKHPKWITGKMRKWVENALDVRCATSGITQRALGKFPNLPCIRHRRWFAGTYYIKREYNSKDASTTHTDQNWEFKVSFKWWKLEIWFKIGEKFAFTWWRSMKSMTSTPS